MVYSLNFRNLCSRPCGGVILTLTILEFQSIYKCNDDEHLKLGLTAEKCMLVSFSCCKKKLPKFQIGNQNWLSKVAATNVCCLPLVCLLDLMFGQPISTLLFMLSYKVRSLD